MEDKKNILSIRIKELRTELGLTQEELAKKLGLNNKSSIANYESGYSIPSDEIKKKMCETFNCTMDYLMGQSEYKTVQEEFRDFRDTFSSLGIKPDVLDAVLYQNNDLSEEENKILDQLLDYTSKSFKNGDIKNIDINAFLGKYALTNLQKVNIVRNYIITLESQAQMLAQVSEINSQNALNLITEYNEELKTLLNNTNKNKYYMCPVYGRIAAGQPNWAEECIEGRIPIDPELMGIVNPEEHFFLRVNGESMNNVIKNGAFALIHKQDTVKNGEIAVVLVNGDTATLKRFTKKDDIVVLEPDSSDPEFKTQIYDKTTPIRILGKYVGKMEINN